MNVNNNKIKKVQNLTTATDQVRVLTLMDKICSRENLNKAYRKVKSNKGGAGIDDMSISELSTWIRDNKSNLIQQLLTGNYQPQPLKGVKIPKGKGKYRQLSIPTLVDRLVQQAILQILTPIFDPNFSESSFGFRPKRSAHQAIKQASKYVEAGRSIVIDLDLENFFDKVNHDMLMSKLAKKIDDKILLKLIRKFLNQGILNNGVKVRKEEGVPQGGPLSPLLANILLDDLDKELERRGHKFARYADDCNIYVKSHKSANRVLASITKFIERLKLKVNSSKSKIDITANRQFLGYTIIQEGKLSLSTKTIERIKSKIKLLTKRNGGVRFEKVIYDLNQYLKGWINYFKLIHCDHILTRLEAWTRRRLRSYRIKQRKRTYPIVKFLTENGVSTNLAWKTVKSNKSWWALSITNAAHTALPNSWFEDKLLLLSKEYERLKVS